MRIALFLRGINVGGVRVPMPDLRAELEHLGLTEVRTVLATGNVIAEAGEEPEALLPDIEAGLSQRFAYQAHVQMLRGDELRAVVEQCPLPEDPERHRYAVLCTDVAAFQEVLAAGGAVSAGPRFHTGGGVIYWSCPRGATTTDPVTRVLARRALAPRLTTRNLATLQTLLAR